MAHSDKKDPKLNEVRAVLQRLQGLPPDGESDDVLPAGADSRQKRGIWLAAIGLSAVTIVGAVYLLTSLNQSVDSTSRAKPGGAAPGSAPKEGQVAAKAAASTQAETKNGAGSVPPASSPPRRPTPAGPSEIKPTLDTALDLMAKGRIRAARERLLPLADDGLPPADVAWALARSYDPNHLVTLPAPDAAPDIREATRWYRLWYGAAVRQGLVADSVSLERIIGSMRE